MSPEFLVVLARVIVELIRAKTPLLELADAATAILKFLGALS